MAVLPVLHGEGGGGRAAGNFGLVNQLGSAEYVRPRKFRERLERWLDLIRTMWPECPARIAADGQAILIHRAQAIRPQEKIHV